MVTVNIDETTEAGKRILRKLSENPEVQYAKDFEIPLDENRDVLGKGQRKIRTTPFRTLW
ncbi:MAG: hypothetical protein LBT50_03415 [Prevotellaceae bacterium]|jgi:hypothetical protein|nr:hypothetical protein [Prevotellaceae bacterium]